MKDQLGALIAVGRTAEVYAWQPGTVIKWFRPGVSQATAEYEARLGKLVHAAGMPAPAVGEIVDLDGRPGLVYEFVDGQSMLQAIQARPWKIPFYARLLAGLHVQMHQIQIPGLPSQKQRLQDKINQAKPLPEAVRAAALAALQELPEAHFLCHGDFHPDNILITAKGPIIIDWIDAVGGFPLADVARSSILMGGGSWPPGMPWIAKFTLGKFRSWFHRLYLEHYFRLQPAGQQELSHWLPVVAAARLDEGIQEDETDLLAVACRLVAKGSEIL